MRQLAFSGIFLLIAGLAVAAPRQAYDESAFKTAQAAGKPIIVEIHAYWCVECMMQNRTLSKLAGETAYAALVRFRVDYDKQKELVKAFGAKKQSTLVLFKGDKEVGRAVGITREAQIKELLSKAIWPS